MNLDSWYFCVELSLRILTLVPISNELFFHCRLSLYQLNNREDRDIRLGSLVECLTNENLNEHIVGLDLSESGLNDNDMEIICTIFHDCSNLQILNLSKNPIGNHGILCLTQSIYDSQLYIQELNLKDINISDDGLEFFEDIFYERPPACLNLMKNPLITWKTAEEIIEVCEICNIDIAIEQKVMRFYFENFYPLFSYLPVNNQFPFFCQTKGWGQSTNLFL